MNVPKLRFKEFNDDYNKYIFDEIAEYKKGPFGSALKKEIFVPKSENSIKVYEQQNAIKKDWTLERYFITKDYYEKLKGFTIKPGDIIVSCAGTIGEYYVLPKEAEIGVINQALMRINTNEKVNQSYFLYIFDNMVYNFSKTFSNGSAIKNIPPFADLKKQIAFVPSINEQNKVAKTLELLDKKIELQSKKIEGLKLFKISNLNKIYSSKNWKNFHLYDALEISNTKNDNNLFSKESVLSVSDEYGVVNQIELQGRSFAAKELNNYKVVKKNQIIYTRSPLSSKPYGIIKIVGNYEGIVSPLYIVNNVKNNIDPYFIYYMFDLPRFTNNYLKPLVRMGAKHTMNISEKEWLSGMIKMPASLKEQNKISNFFQTIDKKIKLENDKLDKLNELKKGLMQNMFV